jgi:hypothetical protein
MLLSLAAVVGVFVIAVVAFALLSGGGGGRGRDTEAAPVEGYPYAGLQMFAPDPGGRTHFPVGQTYDAYNSDPPTSGPHTAAVQPGVYDDPVPKEHLVHNMEHSQVVVWYNCNAGPAPLAPADCQALGDNLAGIVNEANGGGKKVVMTPYANMEQRIALTAWQFLDTFNDFDAQRVRTFVDTFYCHTNLEGFC